MNKDWMFCSPLLFVVVLCLVPISSGQSVGTDNIHAIFDGSSGMYDRFWRYMSNDELVEHMESLVASCHQVAEMFYIGESLNETKIYGIRMTSRLEFSEGLPKVKLVGNLHGDEPTGRVFALALAHWLCLHQNGNDVARKVLDSVNLYLIPVVNPDGFAMRTRANMNGRDLNRDFPDRLNNAEMRPTGKEQTETQMIMDWILQYGPFVSSLAFHEGALVANYPWDGSPDKTATYQACPDDATFKQLATVYATSHRIMSKPTNEEFPHGGVTNGAAWYPIYGSMQDWNYVVAQCMELTIEASVQKWPDERELPTLFEDNRMAILNFITWSTYGGFHGHILDVSRDRKTKQYAPVKGTVQIEGSNLVTYTDAATGAFYRPLSTGTYFAIIDAPGYAKKRIKIMIPAKGGLKKMVYIGKQQQGHTLGWESFAWKGLQGWSPHTYFILSLLLFIVFVLLVCIPKKRRTKRLLLQG